MRLTRMDHQFLLRGFTLIELSIVLVIIGLIVGGVLVGRDLIQSAAIRSQIAQMIELETQVNSFRVKHNCLPGDCANATDYFGTTDSFGNSIENGNGDTIIRSTFGGAATTYTAVNECLLPDILKEVAQLFLHLKLAGISKYHGGNLADGLSFGDGIIPAVGQNYLHAAYGNGTGVFISCLASSSFSAVPTMFGDGSNIMVIGAAAASGARIYYAIGTGNITNYADFGAVNASGNIAIGLPINVIKNIDLKIDDGLPQSGKFGAISGDIACGGNTVVYPSGSSNCRATGGKRLD